MNLPERIGRFVLGFNEKPEGSDVCAVYEMVGEESRYMIVEEEDEEEIFYHVIFKSFAPDGTLMVDETVESTDDLEEALETLVDYVFTHDPKEEEHA